MGKISKLVALTLLMSFAISQTTGKIRGTVTSADGQPLAGANVIVDGTCLLYTSPSPRDAHESRMPSSA